MCILFFAIRQHPDYPLIICANRDEFYQRPTKAMHRWPDADVIAGKDLKDGGTWLGVNQQGRFAALTNYRQGINQPSDKPSRGVWVQRALTKTNQQLLAHLQQRSAQYNGFNLVYGDSEQLYCFDSVNQKHQILTSGYHSICNGALDDIWPKMSSGVFHLEQLIAKHQPLCDISLNELMKNSQQAPSDQLPSTGIDQSLEQLLSSIFIQSPNYGTRATTIIKQDKQGRMIISEQSYNNFGEQTDFNQFELKLKN